MIDELVNFAKLNHPGFAEISEQELKRFFETYANTILISFGKNHEITGFAIYQEWPDLLNFIAIAGSGTREENLRNILAGIKKLPNKKIVYFDEEKMELKTLCLKQHQY